MNAPNRQVRPVAQRELPPTLLDRLPPQDLEAEQAVLGGALVSKSAAELAVELLAPEDFYLEAHRKLFAVVAHLHRQDVPPDLVTVPAELRRVGQLDACGGMAYVGRLCDAVPTAAHTDYYAQIVARKATLRRVIEASQETVRQAFEEPEDLTRFLADRLHGLETAARAQGKTKSEWVSGWDWINEWERALECGETLTRGPRMPWQCLDDATNGWQPEELTILAGYPGAGKTAALLSFLDAAGQDTRVALFSLEMNRRRLIERLMAHYTQVPVDRFRRGEVALDIVAKGVKAMGRIADRVHVNDCAELSVQDMRVRLRELTRSGPVGLVIVDYLQRARASSRAENRNQQVGQDAIALKNLAREFRCSVLVVSSLAKPEKGKETTRPSVHQLRESGDIHFEADGVWVLHRPDIAAPLTELHVAKGRNVASGQSWFLDYDGPTFTFRERNDGMTPSDDYAPPANEARRTDVFGDLG